MVGSWRVDSKIVAADNDTHSNLPATRLLREIGDQMEMIGIGEEVIVQIAEEGLDN
jgi:transketolase C-terminal domain/subunit